jgi:hypothetical protein
MLRQLSEDVTISAEVNRYMQDVVVFLRLNRAVSGGVSPKATIYLDRLVRYGFRSHGRFTILTMHVDVSLRCITSTMLPPL